MLFYDYFLSQHSFGKLWWLFSSLGLRSFGISTSPAELSFATGIVTVAVYQAISFRLFTRHLTDRYDTCS